VIVAMHVAAGAAAGALTASRAGAVAAGLVLHGLQDAIPHEDISSRRFETASGVALLAVLAVRRGLFDPTTLGGAACAAPDLEHVLPLPRPGGRELYPSHRVEGWHQEGGFPAWAQLAAAGVIVAAVIRRRRDEHGCGGANAS
jgi:hypothetical protein